MTREVGRIQVDIPDEAQELASRLRAVVVELKPTGLTMITGLAVFFRTVSEQWANAVGLPSALTLHERFAPEDQVAMIETLATASERGLLERPLSMFAAFSMLCMQAAAAACDPENFAPKGRQQ